MIGVIGIKRLFFLFVFIAINVVLAAGVYMYLTPKKQGLEREKRALGGQLSVVRSDMERMKIEFEQLDAQQDYFDDLKMKGFFSAQERSNAKVLFSEIQADSNVISAVVSVDSGVVGDDKEAEKANHKVLISPVEVEIRAFDDGDIYRYIEMALDRFPGHLSFDRVEISRIQDVSSPVLRAIASGAYPEMVYARLGMSWRTLIPDSQIIEGREAR